MARKETAEELRESSIFPLYHQIATAIEKAIQKRIYPEGSMIPSEKELGETYQVSRVTVRQAMQRLLDNNLIVRKPGLGTFVRRKVITQTMDELLGFYPSLLKRGLKPRIQILEYQVVSPKPEVEKDLRLPPGEKILRFVRQYFLDKNVLVTIQMNIPYFLARHWTQKEAAVKNSFCLLQEHAGVQIRSSALKIRASLASREIGGMLKIPKGSPILELRRLTYSVEEKPVEYAVLSFPGDSYELTVQLQAGDWQEFRLGNQ